ncbi:ApaG protein [Fodinibius salinus]|uniref:ApaG protein n=1 Tax=Fodinibius salinus TaxID=860790 RepID=A0A5D3YNM6_9BACT|nr:Co2+/Mg2+ efflux protein ApaG [Fodinibius salinus]TYP93749.1 ApaG protein [Fodinibius salinus]
MYRPKFVQVSHDISVSVKPMYLEEESNPLISKHVFAYFITIENIADQKVQLLKRHWQIHDSSGKDHQIEGEGVVGKQPMIEPGSNHQYNSFCVLDSYQGSMSGYYIMERADGEEISVQVPEFILVSHLLN